MEDTLLQIMDDEFEVAIEDDSEKAIARDLVQVWETLQNGDPSIANVFVERWNQLQSQKGTRNLGQRGEDDGSSSEEEGSSGEGQSTQTDEQMRDADERPKGPIIDDDGFELVQSRRKR